MRTVEKEAIEKVAIQEVVTKESTATGLKWTNKYLIILGIAALLGAGIYGVYEYGDLNSVLKMLNKDNHLFYWMLLVGFLAEIVAGSMGMGYGVICTTILLILNVPPTIISASIHSAESFTTAAGSSTGSPRRAVNRR